MFTYMFIYMFMYKLIKIKDFIIIILILLFEPKISLLVLLVQVSC